MSDEYTDEYNDEYTDIYNDEYNDEYDAEYKDEYRAPLAPLFPNPSFYTTGNVCQVGKIAISNICRQTYYH